jgi:hypothetical protein
MSVSIFPIKQAGVESWKIVYFCLVGRWIVKLLALVLNLYFYETKTDWDLFQGLHTELGFNLKVVVRFAKKAENIWKIKYNKGSKNQNKLNNFFKHIWLQKIYSSFQKIEVVIYHWSQCWFWEEDGWMDGWMNVRKTWFKGNYTIYTFWRSLVFCSWVSCEVWVKNIKKI